MSSAAPTTRPGSVTTVMVLTWIVAILSIIGGILYLLASEQALNDAGIAASTASTYGWVDIGLGVVIALVAIGLGSGNNFSRFLVSLLMVLRLGVAVWAMFALSGTSAFWAVMVAAGFALLVLIMLWNGRANEFFRTN